MALVYGLSSAATTPDGVSHWGDPKVLASLSAAVVLLAAFVIIEARSRYALMPLRIFRNRDRSAANLIMLCIGTAMFGMFFFLTLFVQNVWGYSALKTGVAYLPMVAIIMAMAGLSAQLVPRIGARPLLIVASVIAVGGVFWLSRITEHSTYAGGLLGPMLVAGAGFGLLFMPATLVALSKVEDKDAGLASSLPNVGQQVGGAIGLAILGTVAWTVVADTARNAAAAAKAAAARRRPGGSPAAPDRGAGQSGADRDLRPRAGHRVLPRLRRVGRDHGAGPHRGGRHGAGDPRRPRRHRSDGGLNPLRLPSFTLRRGRAETATLVLGPAAEVTGQEALGRGVEPQPVLRLGEPVPLVREQQVLVVDAGFASARPRSAPTRPA